MRRWVLASAVLSCASAVSAAVAVHQVEASESSAVERYAPVDFAGSPDRAGEANFAGITFHALDTVTDTFSSHASAVGNGIYGTSSGGYPFVQHVYNDSVDHFYDAVVRAHASPGVAPVPGYFGNGVKVSNHSYAGTFGDSSSAPDVDQDAVRRLDFMAVREDVVVTVAAVADPSPGSTFYHSNLAWAARNAVAVKGDQTFDPAGGTLGRPHADLWFPAPASYGTATVGGYATGLVGNAQSLAFADATHNVNVKSLLMTGADAPASPTLGNHLDPVQGAGRANFARSLAILQGGERPVAQVTRAPGLQSTPPPQTSSTPAGFAFGSAPQSGYSAVFFTTSDTITGLVATLNWNVTSRTFNGAADIDTTDAGLIFSDLALQLATATPTGGAGEYHLTPFDGARFRSDVAGDNVEHLRFDDLLPAGTYALLVRGDPARATTFGFSYALSTSSTPLLLGDANGDGKVDAADRAILTAHLGTTATNGYAGGDFNFDDLVDADDFMLFQQGAALYGQPPTAQTPEPAIPTLLAFAWTCRRRRSN